MHPYDYLINSLAQDVSNQRGRIDDVNKYNCLISIDSLFDVLYDLFNSNNLLIKDMDIQTDTDYNKFVFTEEYPNSFNVEHNIVTFELTKRAPASLAQGSSPFHGVKQYRPMYRGESKDIDNNDTILHYSHLYDNEITMTCWSSTSRGARLTASLVESIMSVAYFFIRKTVDVFIMNGRHEPIFTTKYDNKKLVGIPISFFVRTNEVKTVKKETLEQLPAMLLQGFRIDAQIST